MTLNFHVPSDQVQSMMKPDRNNNVANRTNAIYAKDETKLSWSIEPGWSVRKTIQDNDMIDCIGLVYVENDIKLLKPIKPGMICDKTR